jgi:predicted MFS family arabinose efflux permease
MKFLDTIVIAMPFGWRDYFAVPAAVALAALISFTWAILFRKKHRRHHHRRHRRQHRPLNPTLAQTGGLPPTRKPENPPDQPKS